jgi:hypothetical protein
MEKKLSRSRSSREIRVSYLCSRCTKRSTIETES